MTGRSSFNSAWNVQQLLPLAVGILLFSSSCLGQSIPTAAPTIRCQSELNVWTGCVANNGLDAEACSLCNGAYLDGVGSNATCPQLTTAICTTLDTCAVSCGPCVPGIARWHTCIWGSDCFVGCTSTSPSAATTPSLPTTAGSAAPAPAPSLPTTTGSVAPAPAPAQVPGATTVAPTPVACANENTMYETCAFATADGYAGCLQCQDAYIETIDVNTVTNCDESAAVTCGIYTACPGCQECQTEEVALINCMDEGSCEALECSSSSSSSAAPGASPSSPSAGGGSPAPASAGPGGASGPPSPASPVAAPTPGGDGGAPTMPTSASGGNNGTSSAARCGASMFVAAAAVGTVVSAAAIGGL